MMPIFHESEFPAFIASDKTLVQEILHPSRTGIDLPFSIARASLNPGEQSHPHRLPVSTEIYLIRTGHGKMHIDGIVTPVSSGDVVVVPPNSVQYLVNNGIIPILFDCLVTPPWKAEEDIPCEDPSSC
jgi:cytosine deaminase